MEDPVMLYKMTHVVVFLRTSAEVLLAEARREVRSGVEGHRSGLACRWRRVSRQLETMHDKHARSPFFWPHAGFHPSSSSPTTHTPASLLFSTDCQLSCNCRRRCSCWMIPVYCRKIAQLLERSLPLDPGIFHPLIRSSFPLSFHSSSIGSWHICKGGYAKRYIFLNKWIFFFFFFFLKILVELL